MAGGADTAASLGGEALFMQSRVVLTEEEQQYLEEHPTIVVAADTSWIPLEYVKDGEYSGVIAEVAGKLEDYTGFKIEYVLKDSYGEALKAVQDGEADVITGVAYDETVAAEYKVHLTDPYLTINSSVVSKKDMSGLYNPSEYKRIAVVAGDYANAEIRDSIQSSELIECASNAECLDLVKKDKVDLAIIASYCAEYYMSTPRYSALKSYTIPDFEWNQAVGVGIGEDPRMLAIINKGIDKITMLDMNEAVYDGLVGATYDNELLMFVYKHPILVIGMVLAVVLVVGTLVGRILVIQKREQMRKLEDGARLKLALERTNLCIWELDIRTHNITQIDNEHEKHGFCDLRENIPISVIEHGYLHPDDVQLVRDVLEKVNRGEQDVQGCWRIREVNDQTKEDKYWWEQVLFHIVYDEKNRPIKAIGVSENVTKEKEAQHDSLTSVYNRSNFEQKANLVLNERRASYEECAYMILDLDSFKQINDTYGHGMGDRVLVSVGAVLKKTFRESDILGRMGGDEFTIFMTSIRTKEDALKKAQNLVENICDIQKTEGYPFQISCSVGVVVSQRGQEKLADLYKKADTALYEAKRQGKNQFRIYEAPDRRILSEQL